MQVKEKLTYKNSETYINKKVDKLMAHFKHTFTTGSIRQFRKIKCDTRVTSLIICLMCCLRCVETESSFCVRHMHCYNDFACSYVFMNAIHRKLC